MDLANVTVRAVSPVYAIDAMIQMGFLYGWLRAITSATESVSLVAK